MNHFRYLVYSIAFAVLGYGIWAGMNDGEEIRHAVSQIGVSGLLFLCALSICNYVLRYVRWYFLLRCLGDKPRFYDGLICYWAGFALTTTPGKMGEAIRCLYFNSRHGVNNAHSFAALLVDRISDLLPALLMSTAAFFYFPHLRWIGWLLLLLLLVILLVVYKPGLLLVLAEKAQAIAPAILLPFLQAAPRFFDRTATLVTPGILLPASALGLISWTAEAYGFSWLANLLGANADMMVLMGIFFVAMMAGVVTPGGLGGTEAVMATLLMAVGVGASQAFVVALICRIATLWLSIVIGLLSMLWLEHHKPNWLLKKQGMHR